MANKSIKNRIKITKGGKIRRRVEGLGHNRSKWGSNRKYRKISEKELGIKGGRNKGDLNKTTLLKQEADIDIREAYIKQVSPHLKAITDISIEQAKIPKNTKERETITEQLIDKPKQRTEIDMNIEKLEDLSKSIRKILEK